MRTLLWFILGYGLAVAAALCAIAAGTLVGLGVAAHFLLKREPGMANIISFDPSGLVGRAPAPALISLGFITLYLMVALRLRARVRAERSAV